MTATILIAEDDRELQTLLQLALRAAGHRVQVADDGAEALALAKRERPDLVVSNIMMPRLSGTELVAQLRAGGDHGPPVLLISGGQAEPALPPRTTFLAKPFGVDDILRAIESMLPARD